MSHDLDLTADELEIIELRKHLVNLMGRVRHVVDYAESKQRTRIEPWQEIIIMELKKIVEQLEQKY